MLVMRRDDVQELARLCASEDWRKVKEMADSFASKDAGPARFFQAISRLHLGEHLAAWFCCERALSEFPESAELLDLSGRICAALGDREASRVFHERALENDEACLLPALAYNYATSMARLEEWATVRGIVDAHGDAWDTPLRESLAFGITLASTDLSDIATLVSFSEQIHARSPHAPVLADRLCRAGALEDADELMRKCLLVGNEAEISANRVLLWLDAGDVARAYEIWHNSRDDIRTHSALGACVQAQLLARMGSEDAAMRIFAAQRSALNESRMREVQDHFCVTHAELVKRSGKPRDARRLLVQELQSTAGNLERTLAALRSFAADRRVGMLQWWEVAYARDGDHQVELRVAAASGESARALAIETLPHSLQALPLSVCRLVDGASPDVVGVYERKIGYRISRTLLSEFAGD